MPTAAPSAPPSAMNKSSLKSRFSFGRSASLSLSKASIFSFKSVPAPAPAPSSTAQQPSPVEPVPVKVKVPPPRHSEDLLAVNRKPSIVLDSPQNSPPAPSLAPPRTPSTHGSLSRRPSSRVSFERARPSLDLAYLHTRTSTSPSPSPSPSPSTHLRTPGTPGSLARASPNSSAFDLSSLQFSRDEIPVPIGDSSAETRSSSAQGDGDQSFDIDALDPDLAMLLHPGPGKAKTSTPARPNRRKNPPVVTSAAFFDRDISPVPSIDEFGVRRGSASTSRSDIVTSRARSNSAALRSPFQLQPAISISRPGTAPPEQQYQHQPSVTSRRRGLKRSTSVEDVIVADLAMSRTSSSSRAAGRASLDYTSTPAYGTRPSFDRRGSLDTASPSFDGSTTGRPSIDTVRASRRVALERSSSGTGNGNGAGERANLFTTSLRARRQATATEHDPYWERDERTWRPAEFGAQSEYGGARSEFTGSGSGGARSEYGGTRSETNYHAARSEYGGARSEFGGARSASEYAGPTSAYRRSSPLSPSPTPTRSVASSATLADELERVRSKHAAETEALLAALGDAQRSARVLREENERLRTRVRELEERERERAEEARRVLVARERKPALVPRVNRTRGHTRVVSGATTVRASPSPTPSPTPSPGPAARYPRSHTAPQLHAYDADDSFGDALQTSLYPRSRTTPQLAPDSSMSMDLDPDEADALDAQIKLKFPPSPHRRGPSDASASSFAMSLPPEGQSLLRDTNFALPDTDAEPDDVGPRRQRSHAVLADDDSFDEGGGVLDGLEASPTLVLGRTKQPQLVVKHAPNRSVTDTELSASPDSGRSLKLRPEHEGLFGFESEADL